MTKERKRIRRRKRKFKQRLDIDIYKDKQTLLWVFRSYGVELFPAGKNGQYTCFSPFQKERTPSCRIASIKYGKTGLPLWGFKDFSSGIGGDVFDLIMHKQGVCFAVALWIVVKKISPHKALPYIDPMQISILFPARTAEEFLAINFPSSKQTKPH